MLRAACCAVVLGGCSHGSAAPTPSRATLKGAFQPYFRVGTAISPRVFDGLDSTDVRIVTTSKWSWQLGSSQPAAAFQQTLPAGAKKVGDLQAALGQAAPSAK